MRDYYFEDSCTNAVGNDECSKQFMSNGHTCNAAGYDFAKNCAKYCEFCS